MTVITTLDTGKKQLFSLASLLVRRQSPRGLIDVYKLLFQRAVLRYAEERVWRVAFSARLPTTVSLAFRRKTV